MVETDIRVVLIGLAGGETPLPLLEEHLEELERLVDTAGGKVVACLTQDRSSPDPHSWLGKGKCRELAELVAAQKVGLVVAEGELSPAQMRTLQDESGVRVIDRADLILDIFAKHARSREARISVELALLEQQMPRLAGQWYGLSRQGGGIGSRGLGEKKLELDRRVVRTRISRLKKDLGRMEVSRDVQRRGRERVAVVALAGYTNAGKSTLFTALTADATLAMDRLFATLDARHARLPLPGGVDAVLVDTVGFIRRLPHRLVASFRSTLAEVRDADVVIHVVDAAHPAADEQEEVARQTLEELGVESERVLVVRNKVDLLPIDLRHMPGTLSVSARTGEGLDELRALLARRLSSGRRLVEVEVDPADGRTIAEVRREGEPLEIREEEGRIVLRGKLPPRLIGQLNRRPGIVVKELG